MKKRKGKMHLALGLCVALTVSCMDLSGFYPGQKTVQAEEMTEPSMPTGGVDEIEVYEVPDVAAVENVPSYEDVIIWYRQTEDVFVGGTGDYAYNSLSDAQKVFYESLETSLTNFSHSANASFEMLTFSSGGTGYTPFRVNYDQASLSSEQVRQVWTAFRADHPWLFWLHSFAMGSGSFMPLVTEEYQQDLDAKKAMDVSIKNGVQEYLDAVDGIDDTYEKVRIIYDKIIHAVIVNAFSFCAIQYYLYLRKTRKTA